MKNIFRNYQTVLWVTVMLLGFNYIFTAEVFADSTVVVRPTDMAVSFADVSANPTKWLFYNDENDTVDNSLGSFVPGPGTPPLGSSSVQISVSGTQRRNLATYQFSGTPLAAITQLRFSTYNPSAGNSGSANRSAYLNFNVDFTGSNSFQKRLVFVPRNNGTVIQNSWQEWDALQGGSALWSYSGATWPVASAGPHMGQTNIAGTVLRTWGDILTDYPGVRIISTNSWLGMRVGEPYPDGYTEDLDKFVFGTASGVTTFDFELPPVPATLHVIKLVVSTNGGSATSSDFNVYVRDSGLANVAGSPTLGASAPGTSYSLSAGAYTISEDPNPSYIRSFSGNCDSSGSVTLAPGDDKICTIINTDIPLPAPVVVAAASGGSNGVLSSSGSSGSVQGVVSLLGIIKVPTPLAIQGNFGSVTYNYTVWSIGGQQTLANVAINDDKCAPVVLRSGDSNADNKLNPGENWNYSCTTNISQTTTNTAVVTAYSDDTFHRAAIATAITTVAVGTSTPGFPNTGLTPPLINVIKIPNRLTALPIGGGDVTYAYTVTNPGAVPINNVSVVDDTCTPVTLTSGDANGDHKLDPNEIWVYGCRTRVSNTTRSVTTVKGTVNGFLALGYAFVDVLVAVPKLPVTSLAPSGSSEPFPRSLGLGAKGDDVMTLQTVLEQKKFLIIPPGVAKGFLGPLTSAAIGKYQASVGLPVVGVLGPLTRAKLASELGN